MRLRKLEMKDVPLMLEWMWDKNVTEYLAKDFNSFTLQDCQKFISMSYTDDKNLHLAVANDNDEYMGTVSLKNIDYKQKNAEFAIALRSCAMGKGFGKFAIKKIIDLGKKEHKLCEIYWYVDRKNLRAIKFYEHCGYQKDYWDKQYIWYKIL